MRQLNLTKIHLAGYSYGGLIALQLAKMNPEIIDKLIIIETPNLNDGQSRSLLEGYNKDVLDNYLKDLSASTQMPPSKRKIEKTHQQVKFLFENTTLKDDLSKNQELFDEIAKNPLKHKTLLLYAKESECHNAATFLHKHLKSSALYYGDGDHSIPVQNPDWIVDKINDFL